MVVALKSKQTRFHWSGKTFDLTTENMSIQSNYFNVDKNGNVVITDNSTSTDIWNFKIQSQNALFKAKPFVWRIENSSFNSSITAMASGNAGFTLNRGNYDITSIASSIQAITEWTDGTTTTTVTESGITTPKVTQTSLEKIKKNIKKQNINALEIIINSDIYSYNLKSEDDTEKKHFGFVIGEKYNTPLEVISGDGQGIEQYSMSSIEWIAIQQLMTKIESLEARILELEGVR